MRQSNRNNRGSSPATKLLGLFVLVVVTLLLLYSSKVPHLASPEYKKGDYRQQTTQTSRSTTTLPSTMVEDLSEVYRQPEDQKLPRASSLFLDKLATCDSLDCLREAHMLPRGAAKFNHPHFLIIGFQKAATTSLYSYLARHNETLASSLKEPEFFVNGCGSKVRRCRRSLASRPSVPLHASLTRLFCDGKLRRSPRAVHATLQSSTFTQPSDRGFILTGTGPREASRDLPISSVRASSSHPGCCG